MCLPSPASSQEFRVRFGDPEGESDKGKTAGQEVEFQVQLKDSYGNTVTNQIGDLSTIKPKMSFAEGDATYLTKCCNSGSQCSRCLGQAACGANCVAWGTCGVSSASDLL